MDIVLRTLCLILCCIRFDNLWFSACIKHSLRFVFIAASISDTCQCSPSASRFNMFHIQRYCSAYRTDSYLSHCCLPISLKLSEAVFFPNVWHQQNIFGYKLPLPGIFLFFWSSSVKSRDDHAHLAQKKKKTLKKKTRFFNISGRMIFVILLENSVKHHHCYLFYSVY